jgi:tryptophan-rich sensory protein
MIHFYSNKPRWPPHRVLCGIVWLKCSLTVGLMRYRVNAQLWGNRICMCSLTVGLMRYRVNKFIRVHK